MAFTITLEPIMVLLEHLMPQVKNLCTTQSLTSDAQVLDFLRGITLVGILPHPQPIFIRKFRWGRSIGDLVPQHVMGSSLCVFISDLPWSGTQVKLFQIKQQLTANTAAANSNNNASSPNAHSTTSNGCNIPSTHCRHYATTTTITSPQALLLTPKIHSNVYFTTTSLYT
ncbi:hypothetical protein O0I10_002900 [Lichtheimia ornata]|uniref:Uncharacterized protein n=1 Tax=Lichtheimia ornata TaxID=688661 RepID=A0AAD7V9L5_9FUNG|nr:uncharacterized protein O0I10_002900 [Lichtheimia ornata]KAJ8661153.1 hypothetical protein O0I10_002900 [Lichtheimia ornata]